MSTETELILNYFEARAEHELAETHKKGAFRRMKAAEATLIDEMLANQTRTVKRDDGTTLSLKSDTNISITKAGTDAIREWIELETGDVADYTETKLIRANVLDFVKKKLEKGVPPEEMPPELKINTRPTVSVRGWKDYLARNEA